MRKRFLLSLLVALLTTLSTRAYDFQSGDLYYNITSDTTVEVTCQESWSESNYQGLTTATIPETVTYDGTTYAVTSIGYTAFYGCSSLTSIILPNSVTSIGDFAFYGCSSLTSITIPNSVTSIGSCAFCYCSSLTSITIPNSVTSIGGGAFSGCSSITSITIPNSVTNIGNSAFWCCSSLTSITIPNSVTSIGDEAFYYCSSLTSITIPNSVTSIGDYAFYNVPNVVYNGYATGSPWGARSVNGYVDGYLVYADETKTTLLACSAAATGEITIPNSVTSIGWGAFTYCRSLTSITIPNSVTSIGEGAFAGCFSLTSMVVESGNTVYDSRENCNAIIETATNTLIAGCQSTTIPNSVKSIGSDAFWDCSSLTSITLPNSVTSIGEAAFIYCSSLTSITIGNSVTSIGEYAFYDCTSLTAITCYAPIPPTCGWHPFSGVPRTIPLYVPAESVEEYKAADTWKEFDVQALLSTDATETDSDKAATKLLRDGRVLILRNGETYNMTGQRL